MPQNLLLSIGGIQMKECRKVRGKFCDFSLLDKKVLKVVPDFFHRVNYTVSYIVDRKMAKNLLEYHNQLDVLMIGVIYMTLILLQIF